jgi:2,3-bisphosphoglycerate-independent phosphoglycerate mutase
MVAPTAIINGLGSSIQLFTPKVEGATGDYHSNYIKKIEKAVELFK